MNQDKTQFAYVLLQGKGVIEIKGSAYNHPHNLLLVFRTEKKAEAYRNFFPYTSDAELGLVTDREIITYCTAQSCDIMLDANVDTAEWQLVKIASDNS